MIFYSNYSQGVACIEQSLSSCDSFQILHARTEMDLWIQINGAQCYFVPQTEIPGVDQTQTDLYQCGYEYVSMATDVTKVGSYKEP